MAKSYKTLNVKSPTFTKFLKAMEKVARERRRRVGDAAPLPTADEVVDAALDALLGGGGAVRSHHTGGKFTPPDGQDYRAAMTSFLTKRR